MDDSYIQFDDEHPTGTVEVTFDEEQNPHYYIVPGVAYDFIEMTDELRALGPEADCLCFGTLIQRTERSRRTLGELLAASPRSIKLLDINLRKDCYTEQTVRLSLEEADILKLNDDEARRLAEMFRMRTADAPGFCEEATGRWSLTHCMVTFGRRGAFVASADGEAVYGPGYVVDPVDSCGCGDAFTAGFIHAHLAGEPLAECCRLANVMGAIAATQEGATAPIGREEIDAFTAADHERAFEEGLKEYATL